MGVTARVLIFSGAGHYADPWHPFPETSRAVADIVVQMGHDVLVRDSEPGALADASTFDLLVLNSGGRTGQPDPAETRRWAPDHNALSDYHLSGAPLLGLHTAVGTFPDWAEWTSIIGGRWTADSFHPEMGMSTFEPADQASLHPIWSGMESVSVIDERYSLLELTDRAVPLVHHMTEGASHTMGWCAGDSVIYDGLGHDARSYESKDRRRLLQNEVRWLLER